MRLELNQGAAASVCPLSNFLANRILGRGDSCQVIRCPGHKDYFFAKIISYIEILKNILDNYIRIVD